jgi:L-fucose isomerase-like protein
MKFALLIANRGFFPSSVISSARKEMLDAFHRNGLEAIYPSESATRHGAVETMLEGDIFARFLAEHRGEYDGLVICLPNFGDENGIKAAIRDCDVPILLQAYPDRLDEMDFEHRRDAFCGKMALSSVLTQMGTKYTTFMPFTIHPATKEFDGQLQKFAAVCRIVKGMKHLRIGAFGARTTAFKSVRYDEMALESHGIDVETFDLSTVFARIRELPDQDERVLARLKDLHRTCDFTNAPAGRDLNIAKFVVVMDAMSLENKLDTLALRCWSELQQELGITPCAAMGILIQEGTPVACEMDVTNAISMIGMQLAAQSGTACLDWNNNYGDDPNKCILFHCGPLPMDLMEGPGHVEQHKMLSKSYGQGCSWGLNVGKIKTGIVTYCGFRTENGEVQFYVGTGKVVDAPVPKEFFGTYAVLETEDLQKKLQAISAAGFRHHVAITRGDVAEAVAEAFTKYLGYRQIQL